MAKKALGRGLNALFSTPSAGGSEAQDSLHELDIDMLEPNAEQPRSIFRDDKIEELAASIRANGIVQPLVARRLGASYQIIAGERRWRAAQRAGLTKVPVVVREIPDERVLELSLIENIQREELNPIEEANAYKRLIEGLGITQEEVARRVGRERSSVTNYLRLLKLPSDIQHWVEEDRLSMGHARCLLALDSADEQRKIASQVIANGLSVREAERLVKIQSDGGKSRATAGAVDPPTVDVNVRAAEEKLSRKLGTKVKIQKLQQGGRIEIHFYSDLELDHVYSIIMGN